MFIKNIIKRKKEHYMRIRNKLLKDKIDVTAFMIEEVLKQVK